MLVLDGPPRPISGACSERPWQLGLKALFETLLRSLPALWNVGALLLLIFFIYSYVGVLTFGEVSPLPALFLGLTPL